MIKVSLKMALPSGKKGSPVTGGCRHSICSACITGHVSMGIFAIPGVRTIGDEELLGDKAVAKGAGVDGLVVEATGVTEIQAGIGVGGVIGDLVPDRNIQRLARDLARA